MEAGAGFEFFEPDYNLWVANKEARGKGRKPQINTNNFLGFET